MKLYIYNVSTRKHLATVDGDSKADCEARAIFSFGNEGPYSWTYEPDFENPNGIKYNADAPNITIEN